ncbi:MAG: hypothetical protein OEN55_10235 [Alphaproteobacteria bacterium]|nr:hypothetical protein [Alphaproteobacteria bacterium]
MSISRLFPCFGILAVALLLAASVRAQTDDVFAFIPPGGKTLLADIMRSGLPADEAQALLAGKRDRESWLIYLRDRSATIPGIKGLGEYELATLADYLSSNMPLPAGAQPADPGKADWGRLLPRDGRDLVMENCQFCHIITVVVTQDKTEDAWLGTLNKPSHVEIELTQEQRRALARYLVLNAAIPIDLVPEDLRAGGATY